MICINRLLASVELRFPSGDLVGWTLKLGRLFNERTNFTFHLLAASRPPLLLFSHIFSSLYALLFGFTYLHTLLKAYLESLFTKLPHYRPVLSVWALVNPTTFSKTTPLAGQNCDILFW